MVKQLRDLMNEETVAAPPVGFGPDELIARGRIAVRRRRQGWVAAAAAVAVVVGGSTLALTRDRAPEPAPVTPPDAPVVELRDARPAVEGRDYEVVATKTSLDTESNDFFLPRGVLDDGLLVMSQGRSFAPSRSWLLSFPEGEIQMGSTPRDHALDYLGQTTAGDLVFEGEGTRDSMTFHTYTTDGQRWDASYDVDTTVPNSTGAGSPSYLARGYELGADRLWLASYLPDDSAAVLWSAPLGSSDWTEEARVSAFDVSDELLVYADADSGDVVRRDLASGDETVAALPERPGCRISEVTAGDDRAAALTNCPDDRQAFHVDVVDASGDPVFTIALRDFVAQMLLTDRFLTLQVDDGPMYTYAVDLRTLEPTRLAPGWVDRCCPTSGDLLAWSSAPAGTSMATYTLARFR